MEFSDSVVDPGGLSPQKSLCAIWASHFSVFSATPEFKLNYRKYYESDKE